MASRKLQGISLIIVIVVIAVIVVWFLKAPIMSSYLSKKLKVPISILGITMRPSYTNIYRFRIANPRGSKTHTAFSSKKIAINYSLKELFSSPSTIDQILVKDVFLGIEFYNPLGTDTNWGRIFSKLKGEKKDRSKKEVIIRKLIVQNIDVEIYGMGLQGALGKVQRKHIPQLVFENINSKEGFPTEQLIEQIFGSMGIQNYLKNLLSPNKVFKGFSLPFKIGELEIKKPPIPGSDKAA